jgi:hypothetical protein
VIDTTPRPSGRGVFPGAFDARVVATLAGFTPIARCGRFTAVVARANSVVVVRDRRKLPPKKIAIEADRSTSFPHEAGGDAFVRQSPLPRSVVRITKARRPCAERRLSALRSAPQHGLQHALAPAHRP